MKGNTTLIQHYGLEIINVLWDMLSVKTGASYEQLVKDRTLDVLGMDDSKIHLSENDIKRFAVGHPNGSEVPKSKRLEYRMLSQEMVHLVQLQMIC